MSHTKPIIGLAGGVGSGKSTIARLLGSLGCFVIDADAIARQALEQPEVRERLQKWWGDEIFDEHGRPDRRRIGRQVFHDPQQRQRLEGLIHPIVAAERNRLIQHANRDSEIKAIVLDVPLLYEVGLDRICDRVIFVEADPATRLKRVVEQRGWDEEEWTRREKNQMPLDIKRNRAHNVVDSNTSEADRLSQVRDLLTEILTTTT